MQLPGQLSSGTCWIPDITALKCSMATLHMQLHYCTSKFRVIISTGGSGVYVAEFHLVMMQDKGTLATHGLKSFDLASHDAAKLVQQLKQVWDRRVMSQRQVNELHNKRKLLEQEMACTRQEIETAEQKVQKADTEHQGLKQTLRHMQDSVNTMLTLMQSAQHKDA